MGLTEKILRYLAEKMASCQFGGIYIVDLRGNAPSFCPAVLSALLLIREVDPRRYTRIRRCLHQIANQSVISKGAEYAVGSCNVDFREPKIASRPYTVARLTRIIVHESTHGAISARGVRYKGALRGRIERLCVEEEQRFIRTVVRARPDLSKYFDHVRRKFDESRWQRSWNMSFWERITLAFELSRKDARALKREEEQKTRLQNEP